MSPEEIKQVNKTYRKNFASRCSLARKVLNNTDLHKRTKILDFGSGPDCFTEEYVRGLGYFCDSYDIGEYNTLGHTTINAPYDIILCSNVLNIQPTYENLVETVQCLAKLLYNKGVLYCNYPTSPNNFTKIELLRVLRLYFPNTEIRGNLFICSK